MIPRELRYNCSFEPFYSLSQFPGKAVFFRRRCSAGIERRANLSFAYPTNTVKKPSDILTSDVSGKIGCVLASIAKHQPSAPIGIHEVTCLTRIVPAVPVTASKTEPRAPGPK